MFWEIFCPVFAALISAFTILELFQMGLGYYMHRKQTRLREEFEAKVASGEINPMEMMLGGGMPGMGGPGMVDMPPLPTASGNNGADLTHGQYL